MSARIYYTPGRGHWVADFAQIGREAFAAGELAAPALNVKVREALESLPVGGDAARIMRDFTAGWTAANLEAPVPS